MKPARANSRPSAAPPWIGSVRGAASAAQASAAPPSVRPISTGTAVSSASPPPATKAIAASTAATPAAIHVPLPTRLRVTGAARPRRPVSTRAACADKVSRVAATDGQCEQGQPDEGDQQGRRQGVEDRRGAHGDDARAHDLSADVEP